MAHKQRRARNKQGLDRFAPENFDELPEMMRIGLKMRGETQSDDNAAVGIQFGFVLLRGVSRRLKGGGGNKATTTRSAINSAANRRALIKVDVARRAKLEKAVNIEPIILTRHQAASRMMLLGR